MLYYLLYYLEKYFLIYLKEILIVWFIVFFEFVELLIIYNNYLK